MKAKKKNMKAKATLKRPEDVEDLKTLAAMREKPLKFKSLDDFLKGRGRHARDH